MVNKRVVNDVPYFQTPCSNHRLSARTRYLLCRPRSPSPLADRTLAPGWERGTLPRLTEGTTPSLSAPLSVRPARRRASLGSMCHARSSPTLADRILAPGWERGTHLAIRKVVPPRSLHRSPSAQRATVRLALHVPRALLTFTG